MSHLIEDNDGTALLADAWLPDILAPFDVAAALTEAVTPAWTVEREVDPDGNLFIVVLPAYDDPVRPAFILYEENGLAEVGTTVSETWQGKQAFATAQRAVAAIIAACLA
jgi:hypothetical protein